MKYKFFWQLSKRDTNVIKAFVRRLSILLRRNKVRGILYSQDGKFVFKEAKDGDLLLKKRVIDSLNNPSSFLSNIMCLQRPIHIDDKSAKEQLPEHIYKMAYPNGGGEEKRDIYLYKHPPSYYSNYKIEILGLVFNFKRRLYVDPYFIKMRWMKYIIPKGLLIILPKNIIMFS